MAKATETEKVSFEQAMQRLEAIVGRLEQGELPLDQALSAFEEGVGLVKRCQKQLADAELRVEKILADTSGNLSTEDMTR